MLQLELKHDPMIVEVDPLADFKPTSAPRLSALDQLERTIHIGSFSKSFSAALRVGFIACGAGLASDLADLNAPDHVSSSEYCERTVDVTLSEGHYQHHLNRLRDRLGAATQSAVKLFESVGARVFARTPHSLYLWAAPPGVPASLKIAQDLLPQKIILAPARVFSVDSAAVSPCSRFNVGAMGDPQVAKAPGLALRRVNSH